MPVVTDTYTCPTCTGCDPHGCGGARCTFECRAVYDWVKGGACPEGAPCDAPRPAGPCDAAHAGDTASTGCASVVDCSQTTALHRCVDHGGGSYTWDELVSCPNGAGCNHTVTLGPCDAGHVGDEVSGVCFDDCSPVSLPWSCDIVDYELVKTEDCPAGCICPDSLGPCDAGHSGNVTYTDCADPNWA
jgi:hypothetical protein